MVGLSRGRFYQLIGNVSRVRSTTCDHDVPFIPRNSSKCAWKFGGGTAGSMEARVVLRAAHDHHANSNRRPKPTPNRQPTNDHADLLRGCGRLGLLAATSAQVGTAMKDLYPPE